jgi:D-alanyl-D-alanine carboxypeptidase (penicillin-binding protein 5/6)
MFKQWLQQLMTGFILMATASVAFTAVPSAPQLSARSYVLMDYSSGEIIASKDEHERVAPASLTKLMTAYIAEQEIASGKLKLTDKVMISEKAWRAEGSRMFLEVNKEVTVEELMRGIIIQSGNDASTAIAEHIAGSENAFVDLMNQQAATIGMNDTHFMNATGLPDDQQYSSAYDMALLAQAIIRNSENTYAMYKEQWFVFNDIRQPNRNRLLWWDDSVDGLKTGHTDSAGYCLVASAEKNNMRLISVVMGAKSDAVRAEESKQLFTYGFRFYESKEIFPANAVLLTQSVWKGSESEVPVGTIDPLRIVLPRDDNQNLETVVSVNDKVIAPIAQGQALGTVQIISGDKVLVERPIVALQAVEEGGWFKRMWDSILLFFYNLF